MMNARLEELRAKFQENPRRYFAPYANELRKAGDPAQAIAVCRTHLTGQPGHVSGHIVLGQALYEAGEAQEARNVFTASLDLDPENLIALRSLGEIAQINGEFGVARQWYERLLDADPRNAEVSQLLRDIPSVTSAPATATPLAATGVAPPAALPDGAIAEPPLLLAPSFHTSFTGSGPAYKSEEPDEEATEAPVSAHSTDFEPAAHVESVESDLRFDQPVPAAAESATESLDMIEAETFQLPTPAAHDSYNGPSVVNSHSEFDVDLGPATTEPAKAAAEIPENTPADEFEIDVEPPPTPAAEPPRALFAELGFEGPAGDQAGWMTTPSAALSDLESAPENWFDESGASESDEPAPETRAEETVAAEMSAPDQPIDSWFDEVEGATAVESTEVSSEEFWLPPELPQIPSAENAQPSGDHDFHDEAPVAANAHDAPDDDAVVMASAEHDSVRIDAESVDVAPMDEDIDDAVMSEPPAEVSATSGWMEPVEPEPVHAEQWAPPAEPEPPQAAQWTEPAEAEPAQASQWAEPVTSEPVEAAHAPDRDGGDFGAEGIDYASADAANEPALAENVIGHTPSFIDAVSPPPAPFVTETLAELYLQQGFRDEALAIYRQLVERDPANEVLQLRVQAIEMGPASEVAWSSDVPIETRAASQSVRTFFSRLARRPAVTGPSASTPTPSGSPRSDPDIPFAAAASALANLFSASKPPVADEGAAATLAGAFTDPAGRPSRAADRELSLDHLFRDVPPGGSASAGVSLDEFYATPIAPPGSPTEPGEAAGPTGPGGTDIRQFTAWLEGLRKK